MEPRLRLFSCQDIVSQGLRRVRQMVRPGVLQLLPAPKSPGDAAGRQAAVVGRLHIHAGIAHVQHFFLGYFGNFQNIEYNGWIGFNLYPFTLPEHSGKMDFRKIMVNQLLGGCLIFVGSHSNLNTCIL